MADTQNKRKFDDGGSGVSYNRVPPPMSDFELAKQKALQIAARLTAQDATKRSRFDDRTSDSTVQQDEGAGNDVSSHYPSHISQPKVHEKPYNDTHSGGYYNMHSAPESRKVEIPNIKVGLVIGKGGETIKYIQQQSGAKIQITKDMDHNPNLPFRTVELMGTSEQIERAEQLIHDVIAEADAAASNAAHASTGEHIQMNVPTNKVGLIIGRGGETIKSLQSRTGARIQLVPLSGPPEHQSGATERVLTLVGSKQQVDAATELIKELISENRMRPPPIQGGYNQAYNPSQAPQQWGPPAGPHIQQQGYGYQPGYQQHQGSYYPSAPQSYGNYSQQTSSGWNQAPPPPPQQYAPPGGYGYYNQQQVPMHYSQQPQVGGYDQSTAYAEHPPGASQESYDSHQSYGQQYGQQYAQMPSEGYGPPGVGDSGYGQQVSGQPQQDASKPDYGHQNQESHDSSQKNSKQSLEYGYDQSNGANYDQSEASHSLYSQSCPPSHGTEHSGEIAGQLNYGQNPTNYWAHSSAQYNYSGYQNAETSYGEQMPPQPTYGHPSYEQAAHGASGGYDSSATEQQENDPKGANYRREGYGRDGHQDYQEQHKHSRAAGQYASENRYSYDSHYSSKEGQGNEGNDGQSEVVNYRSKESATEDHEQQS